MSGTKRVHSVVKADKEKCWERDPLCKDRDLVTKERDPFANKDDPFTKDRFRERKVRALYAKEADLETKDRDLVRNERDPLARVSAVLSNRRTMLPSFIDNVSLPPLICLNK